MPKPPTKIARRPAATLLLLEPGNCPGPTAVPHLVHTACPGNVAFPHVRQNFLCDRGEKPHCMHAAAPGWTFAPQLVQKFVQLDGWVASLVPPSDTFTPFTSNRTTADEPVAPRSIGQ